MSIIMRHEMDEIPTGQIGRLVTAMDQSVGTILSALRKYKMLGNTIIVFTTDNGGAANIAGSNLPLRGSKNNIVGRWYSWGWFCVYTEDIRYLQAYISFSMILDKKLDRINQWPMLRGGKPSRRNGFVYSINETSAAIRTVMSHRLKQEEVISEHYCIQ
ncbi:ARSB [Mytilus edulis]|uniref:ARSB n=1 Tax=Mytilus edulis TaxID=6550 RepID=A0A8S3VSL0_MYTED|nr:ARSB [Mytilus edulis]